MFHLVLLTLGIASFSTAVHLPAGSSFGRPVNASYDYIVVGGGTAGLTVATRLAQDGRFSVAVIEAGSFYEQNNGNYSVIPGYAFYNFAEPMSPLVQWDFFTQPLTGANNRIIPYLRGKTLGGSSAFNYMVYQRPSIGTMTKWAQAVADDSWTWPNVLKYFARSATFTPPTPHARPANATPGFDSSVFANGPLQVSYSSFVSPVSSLFLKAAQALGVPYLASGVESGHLLGNSWVPSSIDPTNSERSTSQTAYLRLGEESQRLTIYTQSMATKILFNGTTAVGVEILAATLPFTLTANKEVIVSCGALQSPQLLMVSGIGPKATLESLSIPVIADRPGVGQEMWENPLFGVTYAVDVETSSTYTANPAKFAEAIADYNRNGSGFLSWTGGDVFSFETLRNVAGLNLSTAAREALAQFPDDWPDTEIVSFAQWFGPYLGSPQPTGANYYTITAGLLAPLSRGHITINSSSMLDPPIIDLGLISDPVDQELAVAAVRRARQYGATAALQSVIVGEEAFPGSNVTSDAEILSVIKNQVFPFFHASATCKMGTSNDSMAVVDSRGRVFGVRNLRVVDVSAMPFLPPGQPQAVVYMVAEKVAADILASGSSAVGNYTMNNSFL